MPRTCHFVNFHMGMVSGAPVFTGFSKVGIFLVFFQNVFNGVHESVGRKLSGLFFSG